MDSVQALRAGDSNDITYPMCIAFNDDRRALQLIRLMNVPENVRDAMKVAGRSSYHDGIWMHPAKARREQEEER